MNVFFAMFGNNTNSSNSNCMHAAILKHLKHINPIQQGVFVPLYSNANCQLGFLHKHENINSLSEAINSPFENLPLVFNTQLGINTFVKQNLGVSTADFLNNFCAKISDIPVNTRSNSKFESHHCGAENNDFSAIFAQLTGHFSLVNYCKKAQNLCLATSAFNPQPLFYACLPNFGNTYIISSNIKIILSLVTTKVDKTSLALWLSGRPNPNRSMYSNVHQVPQANYVLISNKGEISTKQFWDINPNASLNDTSPANMQSKLLSLLTNSTSQSIEGDQSANSVFSQLSGGMDSTSVSAIAYGVTNRDNKQLHSISHTYNATKSCDEISNITAMTSTFDFAQSHFIELDKYTQMSFAELYPTHPQSPGMVLSPKYYEEAKLMQQHKATILLTGNGGDEMFWGHSLVYYDRLRKGDVKVLKEVVKGAKQLNLPVLPTLRSVFISPFIKYDLMPFLHLAERFAALNANASVPPWLTENSKMLIENAPPLANPFSIKGAELGKYARYEGLFNTSTFNSMRSYQAVFDEFDLQVRHPLFCKEIAEFSFSVPQHAHISNEYPKLLLRQTMDQLLPKQVCWDQQKTVFDQHFAKLVKENAQSLRLLLQHPALQDLGLLNNAKLLEVFDKLIGAAQPSLNVDLLYAILVQSWYQTHIER